MDAIKSMIKAIEDEDLQAFDASLQQTENEIYKVLLLACEKDNVDVLIRLKHYLPLAPCYTDPLHTAIRNDSLKVFMYFIHDLHYYGNQDTNDAELELACRYGSLKVVEHMFDARRHDVDCRDYGPLIQACKYGHFEIVKFLVSKGASIEPIHLEWPRIKKHEEILAFLEKELAEERSENDDETDDDEMSELFM